MVPILKAHSAYGAQEGVGGIRAPKGPIKGFWWGSHPDGCAHEHHVGYMAHKKSQRLRDLREGISEAR